MRAARSLPHRDRVRQSEHEAWQHGAPGIAEWSARHSRMEREALAERDAVGREAEAVAGRRATGTASDNLGDRFAFASFHDDRRKPSALYRADLRQDARELRLVDRVAREHRPYVDEPEVTDENLREDVAEVRGDREVAAIVALLGCESRPFAVNASSAHVAADDQHGVPVPVIGAAVAVFLQRAPELRHGEDHGVGHAIAQVDHERGDAAREIVEAIAQLTLRRSLIDVSVPPADVRKRDLEAQVGLRELSDLFQRLAER